MILIQKYDVLLEVDSFIQWIESMAAKGWQIKYINEDSFLVHFKKTEPQILKYSLYIQAYAKFSNDEFIDVAKLQGWELVSRKSNLFLFKSSLEDPTPLETDINELENKQVDMIKNSQSNLLYFVALSLFWLFYKSFDFASITYLALGLYSIGIYGRRKCVRLTNTVKKVQFSKWIRYYNFTLIIFFSLFIAFNAYRSTDSKLVNYSPEVIPFNFSILPEIDNTIAFKYESKQSLFSLSPVQTTLIQYTDIHRYNRIIYITQKKIIWDVKDIDQYLKSTQIFFTTNNNVLNEWKNEQDWIIYKNESDSEYLSVFKRINTIYTLHTLNFNVEEHLELMKGLGD